MAEKRKVPLKAQVAAGHEIVSAAISDGRVPSEYSEAASQLLTTFDWLLHNEEAIKLAYQVNKSEDLKAAVRAVLEAKKEFPGATVTMRED